MKSSVNLIVIFGAFILVAGIFAALSIRCNHERPANTDVQMLKAHDSVKISQTKTIGGYTRYQGAVLRKLTLL